MDWKRKLRAHPKNQAMEEVGISKHKEHFLSNGKGYRNFRSNKNKTATNQPSMKKKEKKPNT
jgi:hypothetical protein